MRTRFAEWLLGDDRRKVIGLRQAIKAAMRSMSLP